ncbi:UDP-N-acetylmuramoyl-tripeptide--D-alanyl-D-alanine ligase [Candidatus Peregrinibacteria bacterium]|jgi:UDP-N-acetylmuramoyl-tripeptide--D-alanyl-D-alanine ligase|nr:UDP-N-acetylmuramoyl-tripeptide--D-alanyl-D-alanine ligase [Candidatus Peregrinibacteria bacterium]MBT4631810.1 UDP-N-acetylmuramoyl-tripeptide--D-alanyl-D-alanine ligase [Candidatus Peregrinibacteria bacterium]MBT5517304.1 UDP-N-acetylmuramoyl-tripeptide--D-alanyl-D-alanine ligase [Candidatus Peregrinibacteria bacterium]MBT5824465.1 UDP-N-acetylmuramoyl-tripeptide--D-alanyl-D-alanine ligase [Candidatus Peregrinibacteria bacterium]
MKARLRELVFQGLSYLARHKLHKVKPKIVGITGSAGKTCAKDAIAAVLQRHFKVKKSQKNINSEFGAAFTILDQNSSINSWVKWPKVIFKSIKNAFTNLNPYEVLVMEMGIDAPGGMEDILKVVKPEIMVFLNVKNVHRGEGQFANREEIFHEKSKALIAAPKEGWAILNTDDNFVKGLVDKLPCSVLTIGTEEGADLRAIDIKADSRGLQFTLAYEDKEIPVHLPDLLGACHVYMVLVATAVGFLNGMSWKAIEMELKEFTLPAGRMNKIDGKNGALIIDSSYNASPDTMEEALEVLSMFSGRRIAALGTMNELGELAESSHLKIGKLAARKADLLVAVGQHAKSLAEGAHRAGMSTSMIHTFASSKEAGGFLKGILEAHDVLMVKGSQNNVRMERIVRTCMKEPEQARHLLVRQEPYWLNIL